MNPNHLRQLRPMFIFFVLLTAFLITGREWLTRKGFDADVLIVGNLALCVVMLFSFMVTSRSLESKNPNSFVRAIYGSFIIKFFILAIGAFVYIMATKKEVNKPALFACMGLYIVYTFFEVSSLFRLLKQKKNA